MQYPILYEDNHLLVVAKPAGLLVQADATGDPDLLSLLKAYLKRKYHKPGAVYLGLVHRLDRPVSGVMVFARTSKSASRLSSQFRRHTVTKRYVSLVEGSLEGSDQWSDHLVKNGRNSCVVGRGHPKAKQAQLAWRSVAHQDGLSLVDIELTTGRPHQIRVQFAHRKFPLWGDLRYRASREFDGRNLALHCYGLGLRHPIGERPMAWVQRPPATWPRWAIRALQTRLDGFALGFS